jgi:hypothetical protein
VLPGGGVDSLSNVVGRRRSPDEPDRLGESVENLREGPPDRVVPGLRSLTRRGGESEARVHECIEPDTEPTVVARPGSLERPRRRPRAGESTRRRHGPAACVSSRSALTPAVADQLVGQYEHLLDEGNPPVAGSCRS